MTHLTVSITVKSLEQAVADGARAAERGADLLEYRIDTFWREHAQIVSLIERSALPCILTCRIKQEGGAFDGTEQDRRALYRFLADHASVEPAYVDIELEAYQKSIDTRRAIAKLVDHPGRVKPAGTGLILSAHDFDARPRDLYQRVEAMNAAAACRVMKFAWQARSLRDNLEAFELLQQRHKPAVALCMGEFGLPSRILAKKFGALLTFASLDPQQATAPGQPTVEELKTRYRWDKINEDTQVYGVIGWPVGHSMSPHIHNAGFDAVDHNGVYLPLPIPPEYEHFKASVGAWLDFSPLSFRGASVTIPHKENLIRFVHERDGEVEPLAEQIGAANTLTVRDDGTLYACNTDYAAALDAVCEGVGVPREELNEFRVAVVGAGGAARAIVAGFAHCGATVVIYNRTFDKAEALAESFKDAPGHVVPARMEKLCDSCCHIFINCTPVGMHPHVDATPMPPDLMKSKGEAWGPGTVVFDTVYNPVQTKLLQDARKEGCVTIPGTEMFVRQAAAQFQQWTGVEAPLNLFRDVVHEQLAKE